jgi:hypothetical protein
MCHNYKISKYIKFVSLKLYLHSNNSFKKFYVLKRFHCRDLLPTKTLIVIINKIIIIQTAIANGNVLRIYNSIYLFKYKCSLLLFHIYTHLYIDYQYNYSISFIKANEYRK